jgi:hypothetical protein
MPHVGAGRGKLGRRGLRPTQVAERFIVDGGDIDGGEVPGAHEPGKLQCVTTVGFDG